MIKKKEIFEEFETSLNTLEPFRERAKTCFQMYLGDQWRGIKLEGSKKRPKVTINKVKKAVDVLSGHQRQNRRDIKVFPIEGADERKSDVYTQLFKWILKNRGQERVLNSASKDCIISGLGWIHPYIDYTHDVLNGDINIKHVNLWDLVFDPYLKDPDLSDCNFIFRSSYLTKKELIVLHPKKEKEINALEEESEALGVFRLNTARTKNRVNVLEKWYKELEEKKFLIDINTGNISEFKGSEREAMRRFGELDVENIVIQKRKMPVMKMTAIAGKDVILYDDYSPYSKTKFPFIPFWGYYDQSYSDWDRKVQGIVDVMIEPQREENKRRAQLMEYTLSMINAGYSIIRDANIDIEELKSPGGSYVMVDSHDDLRPLINSDLHQPIVQLMQFSANDLREVGINADLLGQIGQGSSPDASGKTLMIRQRQGLTSTQEIFDNESSAQEELGNYFIELINKNYTREKISKILGKPEKIKGLEEALKNMPSPDSLPRPNSEQEAQQMEQQVRQMEQQRQGMEGELNKIMQENDGFWNEFDNSRETAIYDCKVDEIQSTPTYRIAISMQLQELAHQGHQIPPEVMVEYLDLPQEMKQKYLEGIRSANEARARADDENKRFEIEKEEMRLKYNLAQAKISRGEKS